MTDKKSCFVICPIGPEHSDIRRNSDQVFEDIISPAIGDEYACVRADHVDRTGYISTKIIKLILEADLVIADLTNHNPNVLYELAIRHSFGRPYIHIIQTGQSIPFDIAGIETVFYSLNVRDVAKAQEKIKAQCDSIDWSRPAHANPVTLAFSMEKIAAAPQDSFSTFVDHLSNISDRLDSISSTIDFDVDLRFDEVIDGMESNLNKLKAELIEHGKYNIALIDTKVRAAVEKLEEKCKPENSSPSVRAKKITE